MESLSQLNVADFSAALAADLAADLYEREIIFTNHGMSLAQGLELLGQPWFKAMVEQARRDWDALDNTKDRIKTKAQIALEDSIPTVYGIITDKNTPGAARVAAFKEMKEIAGMGAREGAEGGAVFVPIQIFLDGRDKPPVRIVASGLPVGNEDGLGDEVDEAAVIDTEVVTKAVTHAVESGGSEPCFVLGMAIPNE